MTLRSLLFLSFILLPIASAWAQTAMAPPGGSAPFKRPVAQSTIDQAKRHSKGEFTDMERLQVGGQVQEAWDAAVKTDGVFRYRTCDSCVYRVRLRERMVSVIVLPKGETIERADVGDPDGFNVQPRGARRLVVKPIGFGNDTSLIVYGKSGTVYPFYLRAESFNSQNVPDLVVRIEGDIGSGLIAPASMDGTEKEASPTLDFPPSIGEVSAAGGNPASDDFVKDYPFDPTKLRGWNEYELWGSDDSLKPEIVFRDDHFTYIRYSASHWTDLELPTAYVVVDGLDELVNTRVQGTTFIVESTRPLIVLKSGQSYLCIKFTGGA